MTHEHGAGCCGGSTDKTEKTAGCCGGSGTDGKKSGCCNSGKIQKLITASAIAIAVVALGYAVSANNGGLHKFGPKTEAEVAALIVGKDTVVAKVNGDTVHKSDIAAAIKELGANVPPESVDTILPAFVEQYINMKLIGDAAKRDGIVKDPVVNNQLAATEEQILRAAYLRKLFEGKLTEEALKDAYKAKYEDKPLASQAHARHILVDSEAKAKDIIAKLSAGGSFEKLAAENSKDPSARRGGDLGYFSQADMVKEFGDAVFAMKPGEVSKTPVKTQFGWHVIKLEDMRAGKKPTFEEAKGALEQELRQSILDAKLLELRERASIKIEDAFKKDAPAAAAASATEEAAPAAEEKPAAETAPAAKEEAPATEKPADSAAEPEKK